MYECVRCVQAHETGLVSTGVCCGLVSVCYEYLMRCSVFIGGKDREKQGELEGRERFPSAHHRRHFNVITAFIDGAHCGERKVEESGNA